MVSLAGLSNVGGGFLGAQEQDLAAQLQRQKMLEFQLGRAGDALAGQAFGIQNQPQQPQQQFGGVQPPQGGGMPAQASPGMAPPPTQQGQTPFQLATFGQEGGNRDYPGTSWAGARGPGQIMPGTFAQYARPGEDINNPAQNRAVATRIMQDYEQRWPGDTARQAVAYYSGPGNVAPPGSPTPWVHDIRPRGHPNDPSVSQYAAQVQQRAQGFGQGGQQPQSQGLGPQQQFAQQGIPPTPAGRTFDWALSRLNQVAPNAPPEVKLRALAKMLPLMAPDAREQFLYTMQLLRQGGQSGLEAQRQEGRSDLESQRQQGRTDIQTQKGEQQQDLQAQKGTQALTIEERREASRKEIAQMNNDARREIKLKVGADATIPDEDAEFAAKRVLAGEPINKIVPGYGAQAAANREVVNHHLQQMYARGEIDPQTIARNAAALGGKNQALKTLNVIGSKMDAAGLELEAEIPQAQQALKAVEKQNLRSRYPSWNAFINATEEQLGDPDIVRLQTALKGVAAAYAGVLRRGQGLTVESQRSADALLNKAWSEGQLEASMSQMSTESKLAMKSIQTAKQQALAEDTTTGGKQKEPAADTPAPEKRTEIEPGSKGAVPDAATAELQKRVGAGELTLQQGFQQLYDAGYKLNEAQETVRKKGSYTTPGTGATPTEGLGFRG